jgi:hypothetical protein
MLSLWWELQDHKVHHQRPTPTQIETKTQLYFKGFYYLAHKEFDCNNTQEK